MDILEEQFKSLNNETLKKQYQLACMNEETVLSLTFTLNPKMNNADILSQYRALMREIKSSKIFYYKSKHEFQIHPGFIRIFLVPELTKTINIHLHGILVIDKNYTQYFINELRRLCWNNESLGRMATFHLVNDTFKDRTRVSEYAFKDITEIQKFPDSKKMGLFSLSRKNNLDS